MCVYLRKWQKWECLGRQQQFALCSPWAVSSLILLTKKEEAHWLRRVAAEGFGSWKPFLSSVCFRSFDLFWFDDCVPSLGIAIASSCADMTVINIFTKERNLKFILFTVIDKYCSLNGENKGESGSGWFVSSKCYVLSIHIISLSKQTSQKLKKKKLDVKMIVGVIE